MGFLRPEITSRQQRSPATPLGEDVLGLLRKGLTDGSFGRGISEPSREAMTSVDSFISARETPEQFMQLMGPLREVFQVNTDRAAAQTREAFTAGGGRMSTSLAREEGRVRNEGNMNLQALLSQLFLGDQGNLLNAIGQKQHMAMQNVSPALDFSALGIMPDQTIIQDSPGAMIFKTLADMIKSGASAYAGRPA